MLKFMYIHRQLEKIIEPFLKRKEAISIIGPRQAGKTTFIQFLAKKLAGEHKKKIKFMTFEQRSDLDLFQNNIEDFKTLIKAYDCVIIDEFQYAKEGGQKLKYLYDTTKIKFIISGSSSLDLTFQTGKYMVGRMLDFTLFPFSFREFLSSQNRELFGLLTSRFAVKSPLDFKISDGFGEQINNRLTVFLEKYMMFGGYPAVVLSKSNEEKQKILEGISEKYLLKDIKGLLHLATEDELLHLNKFLAGQISGMLNYQELSTASGLDYKNILKHLNVLEKTFIIKRIKPFFTNRRTELTKNPKNYFVDLGLRNFLLADFRPVAGRNDLGAMVENYAHQMLRNTYPNLTLKYWRTKNKAEVDFVIEKEQNLYPIEIKYSNRRVIGKSFYSFLEKFQPKNAVILTKNYVGEEKIKNTKVKFIPVTYF